MQLCALTQGFHPRSYRIAVDLLNSLVPLLLGTGHVLPKKAKTLRRGQIVLNVGQRITPQEQRTHGTTYQLCKYMRHYYIDQYRQMTDTLDQDA